MQENDLYKLHIKMMILDNLDSSYRNLIIDELDYLNSNNCPELHEEILKSANKFLVNINAIAWLDRTQNFDFSFEKLNSYYSEAIRIKKAIKQKNIKTQLQQLINDSVIEEREIIDLFLNNITNEELEKLLKDNQINIDELEDKCNERNS